MRVRVFVVDDHPIFREGLVKVIDGSPSMSVVGQASDGGHALQGIKETQPDVAVLDVELPSLDGLDLAGQLQGLQPPVPVIILTMHKEEKMFNVAMDRGVMGYILKDNAASDLIHGIEAVMRGEVFLSASISGYLLKRSQQQKKLREKLPGLDSLTPMERRVLKLTAENKTCKEIGKDLFISHRTVETHRNSIATKLELRGNHKLLQFAIEHRSEI